MVGLGVADGVFCDFDRILVAVLCVDGDANLLGEHLELVYGGGTVDVAGHEQRALSLFRFELAGEFAGEGCLTGALQT